MLQKRFIFGSKIMQYIDTTLITILFMIIYKFLVPSRWIKEKSERVERGQKLTVTVTRYNFKSSSNSLQNDYRAFCRMHTLSSALGTRGVLSCIVIFCIVDHMNNWFSVVAVNCGPMKGVSTYHQMAHIYDKIVIQMILIQTVWVALQVQILINESIVKMV